MNETARRLEGRIALVTGASRGVGLGVAEELGAAGCTVYVTGRSRREGPRTDDLPGSVDEAAERVEAAGGTGVAIPCDHTDDDAVAALAARLTDETGRVDVLVNAVWGGYEQYDARLFQMPPWEQPIWRFDKMLATGVRAHYVTTRAILPLLRKSKHPLAVVVSAGDRGKYLGDVQYDVAKAACDRLAFALGRALFEAPIPVVALHPGFTRTERVLAQAPPEALGNTHSARFVGRCVVALATDPLVMQRTGGAFRAGDLGMDYGLHDVDGSRPLPFDIDSPGGAADA